jgi:iron(III) transport system substrate-binding protein
MKTRLMLSAALVAGCTMSATAVLADEPSGTITFYSSMVLDVVEPIIEEFEARHPEINVDLLYSGSVELEQRIFAEIEAGDLRADVIWAANPALFLNLKEAGWLQAHNTPHADAIPERPARSRQHVFRRPGSQYGDRLQHQSRFRGRGAHVLGEFLEWGSQAATASPLHSGTNFNMLGAFVQHDELAGSGSNARARPACRLCAAPAT